MARLLSIFVGILFLLSSSAIAQPVADEWPQANPADVESVESIMGAVYDVISGPAGPRDWDRFRSLFHSEARLIPVSGNGQFPFYMGVDEYIDRAGAQFNQTGFFEKEIHRVEEQYGPLVHAFSTYESYDAADATEPFARGINSFQLLNDGARWWVVNIFWQSENDALPIPSEYLPSDH
jgi:hypothetical protein